MTSMLDKNDLNKIEEIMENKITPLRQEIGSIKQDKNSMRQDIDSMKQDMSSMKQEMGSMKQEMGSMKQEIKNLELKMDTKFDAMEVKLAEQIEYTRQMLHSFREDIREDMKQIMRTSSEDIIAVNDDVQDNKKRIGELEM